MQRVCYLDGLRGFAALQVVALHYLTVFAPGYMAVSLLSFMSGLVLTYSFEARTAGCGDLLTRRAYVLPVVLARAR